jgi:hypothetical protein
MHRVTFEPKTPALESAKTVQATEGGINGIDELFKHYPIYHEPNENRMANHL